jgi:hypothetical protein
MKTPRNASEAAALVRIADRAATITNDYRLIWNRHDRCFMVAHKDDRTRRYRVTARACSCPSFAKYDTCKHFIGLADLVNVEIDRYRLLGFADDLGRMEAFLADIESEAQWSDPEFIENLIASYEAGLGRY